MNDFRTNNNGLTAAFYLNAFNEIQTKSDDDLWTDYLDHRSRPEAESIAMTAMLKYEMLRREAEKEQTT